MSKKRIEFMLTIYRAKSNRIYFDDFINRFMTVSSMTVFVFMHISISVSFTFSISSSISIHFITSATSSKSSFLKNETENQTFSSRFQNSFQISK